MPRLPNADAQRRNVRPSAESEVPAGIPKLRDSRNHHPSTRRWWASLASSPQAGLLSEAAWEWLQAKVYRLDAYFEDPAGATSSLSREVDEIMSKMVMLPRDIIASGYKPKPKAKNVEPKSAATVTSLGDRRAALLAEDAQAGDAS